MSTPRTTLSALNGNRRQQDLQELHDADLDLIVIGGGITGVGIALDAVTRGLRVALLEKHDLGFGTSRWSSKLAHGGLRYLTKLEFGIARDSATERGILMERTAPHLVKALPQVTALGPDTNLFQKAAMRVGFLAGDGLRIMAGTRATTLPRSHYASTAKTAELCPQVRREGLRGGWVNYDGQMVDDARLTCAIARTAASEGARILTRMNVTEASGGRVHAVDTLTGTGHDLSARAVVNATGVWAGGLDEGLSVRPSRGTHLVVDAERVGNPSGALTVPLPGSISRYLFILPAPLGRCYIGLTDEAAPGPIPDVPDTPEDDITFLLDGVNRVLETPLTRDDVRGAFTGLRPLIDSTGSDRTADLSRRHALLIAEDGLVSIVGGKFTEYRLMAQETVDLVVRERGLAAGPCVTERTPIVGSPLHRDYARVSQRELGALPEGLVRRFGNEAPHVLASATVERADEPLAAIDILRAEIEFAVTHEGALSVDDVLDRRTRIGLVASDREAARAEVSEIFDHASNL